MNAKLLALAAFAAGSAVAAVDCRYVPERMDDFVWENEFFGARAYGPKVAEPPPAGEGLVSSGFDVFNKAVPDIMMADTLVKGVREKISYHKFNGRGFDNYKVSTGRGCGGFGMLGKDGWRHEGNWKAQRIVEKSPDKAVFELDYGAYTLRGTIASGEPFCRFDVIPKGESLKGLLVGPGIDVSSERLHDGLLKLSVDKGFIANFEPETEGHVMTAIVVPHRAMLASDDKGCIYLLASAEGGLTYYAGAAWSGAGRFKTAADWHARVADFAARLRK
jgi:hypothetical protein